MNEEFTAEYAIFTYKISANRQQKNAHNASVSQSSFGCHMTYKETSDS